MGRLKFGKEKKRVNFDLLRVVGIWTFQIAVVCLIAFVFMWYFGQRVSTIGDSMKTGIRKWRYHTHQSDYI